MSWKLLAFVVLFCAVLLNVIYRADILVQPPNILLIMVDDMGFSDLGIMGSPIETPHLDHLAKDGLLYTNFYNTGRCCPSRSALLTGQYPHKTGMGWMNAADLHHPGYRGALDQNCVTIAQALQQNDYACYMTGKWHLTGPNEEDAGADKRNWPAQRGFHKYYGHLGPGSYYHPNLKYNNEEIKRPKNYYVTSAVTDTMIQFLKDHFVQQKDKPFFCYVSYFAPHAPLHALPEDIQKYKRKFMTGWDEIRISKFKKLKELGIIHANSKLPERPNNIEAWDNLSPKEREIQDALMAVYAAQLDRVDQEIGKVIDLLKTHKEFDNTLILFLSDNGASEETYKDQIAETIHLLGSPKTRVSYGAAWANVSNAPLQRFKKSVHEGGIATPMIAHWPNGIRKTGRIVDQIGHLIDLFPTILDITNTEYPDEIADQYTHQLPGISLVPNFKGKNVTRDALFFEHEANRAARIENWKLVSTGKRKAPYTSNWELYDLEKDRTETNNVAYRHPEIVKRMSLLWDEWANENDVYPLDGRDWFKRIEAQ